MSDTTNRISMFAKPGVPRCESCPHLMKSGERLGGWCQHPTNRVFTDGWPQGFPPSQGWDGSCDLHPELKRQEQQA
jgi:hypothetical protein